MLAAVQSASELIEIISRAGYLYARLLFKFLARYKLHCVREATVEQLLAFVEAEHLIHYK